METVVKVSFLVFIASLVLWAIFDWVLKFFFDGSKGYRVVKRISHSFRAICAISLIIWLVCFNPSK